MNAYSKIGDQRRIGGAVRLLRSRAYRRGFLQGAGAPALFFTPFSFPRTSSVDASVSAAWKAVSQALQDALDEEGKQIGERSGEAVDAE